MITKLAQFFLLLKNLYTLYNTIDILYIRHKNIILINQAKIKILIYNLWYFQQSQCKCKPRLWSVTNVYDHYKCDVLSCWKGVGRGVCELYKSTVYSFSSGSLCQVCPSLHLSLLRLCRRMRKYNLSNITGVLFQNSVAAEQVTNNYVYIIFLACFDIDNKKRKRDVMWFSNEYLLLLLLLLFAG